MKADKPLFVGQVINHKQYGVGVVTKLPPSNVNLVKAIFEGEDDEKIVLLKYLAIPEAIKVPKTVWKFSNDIIISDEFAAHLRKGYLHRRLITTRMATSKYDAFLEQHGFVHVSLIESGKHGGKTEQRSPCAEIWFIRPEDESIIPLDIEAHVNSKLIDGQPTYNVNNIKFSWALEAAGFPPTNI